MNHLIVIEGPIGAGKTSVMQEVCAMQRSFSAIEPDVIKRMINPRNSASWRRDAALAASVFLAGQLLTRQRSVVTETHSRRPEQARAFQDLAERLPDVLFNRFVVSAPLETCLARAACRPVAGIDYSIDETMVREYYRLPDETDPVVRYDSSSGTPRQIAAGIIQIIGEQNYQTLRAKHLTQEERICAE